jgi:hypothetical protein
MRIGLVRHFKVNHPFPERRLLTKSDVIKWFADYDNTLDLEYKKVDLSDIRWKHCYSSPMLRTVNTANHIFDGQITEIPALKELDQINGNCPSWFGDSSFVLNHFRPTSTQTHLKMK